MKLPAPERDCPECKGPIDWKVIHNGLGAPMYNGLCKKCNIIFRGRETPELALGRNMESLGKIGFDSVRDIDALDKRITSLPGDVQLGLLRERHRRETEEAQ